VKSNPVWDPYEPAPGDVKPYARFGHVFVTTGDRIILFVRLSLSSSPLIIIFCRFGGCWHYPFRDTWSFDVSTRKWTELQCTGRSPSPRAGHAAALVDDVMYVFGGCNGNYYERRGLDKRDDLIAFKLSSK
jgi:hypothetical protein